MDTLLDVATHYTITAENQLVNFQRGLVLLFRQQMEKNIHFLIADIVQHLLVVTIT